MRTLEQILKLDLAIKQDILDNRRGTGKSLAQAFTLIAEAMLNPGSEVALQDNENTSKAGSRIQRSLVQKVVIGLGLKGLSIDESKMCIEYNLPDWWRDLEANVAKETAEAKEKADYRAQVELEAEEYRAKKITDAAPKTFVTETKAKMKDAYVAATKIINNPESDDESND